MTEPGRQEQFAADVAAMQVKTSGNAAAERAASTLGIILMVAAFVISVGSFVNAGNEDNALDQNELIILGFACLTMTIIGAALWLRVALVRFWRFWMLRSLYEGQAHLDEVVKAIRDRDTTPPPPIGPAPVSGRPMMDPPGSVRPGGVPLGNG